jgi:hypothetical protein
VIMCVIIFLVEAILHSVSGRRERMGLLRSTDHLAAGTAAAPKQTFIT